MFLFDFMAINGRKKMVNIISNLTIVEIQFWWIIYECGDSVPALGKEVGCQTVFCAVLLFIRAITCHQRESTPQDNGEIINMV